MDLTKRQERNAIDERGVSRRAQRCCSAAAHSLTSLSRCYSFTLQLVSSELDRFVDQIPCHDNNRPMTPIHSAPAMNEPSVHRPMRPGTIAPNST